MCIMEVRAGEHTTTQLQAEYHNTQTIVVDLEMLLAVMRARKEHERRAGEHAKVEAYSLAINEATAAQATLRGGALQLLNAYEAMLRVADNPDDRALAGDEKRERDTASWERDCAIAGRYETRR
jgi:hypothetical protein